MVNISTQWKLIQSLKRLRKFFVNWSEKNLHDLLGKKKKVAIWVGQRIGGKCRNAENVMKVFSKWLGKQIEPKVKPGCLLLACGSGSIVPASPMARSINQLYPGCYIQPEVLMLVLLDNFVNPGLKNWCNIDIVMQGMYL